MVGPEFICYDLSMAELEVTGKIGISARFSQERDVLTSTARLALDVALPPLCPFLS